ncbi:hypothetical protein [Streptomyces sp. cmx-4-9]|uniref:hypothetical protein n=1 Tax=Streptomyces sp. cmx-4-9 TaxID=2790941 RepID=UPI00397ED55E
MSGAPGRPVCGAPGVLSGAHLEALARLLSGQRGALREVLGAGPALRCTLERHTGPHMDVVREGPAGSALWARWPGCETVLVLPDCPAGGGCGQYLSHPGGHTWEVADPGPRGLPQGRAV